ncbi:hypothetical protein H4J57_15995 [Colwellia sp. BRX8-7]|jgi:hypothetical protein|uniref:hypothetical protein n=1 Tax=Colwellia sp. BRX8-7 TaxID=2759833 RepID=UPI0015F469E2|nr:hypothetical protein [Colwellia sp. BRX8-7]MBA6338694.1 hypothetical protein [Colwellia sp. BRX8-7]
MSNLNLNISLPQNLVFELLKEVKDTEADLSEHIASKLWQCLEKDQDELLKEAIFRAAHEKKGDTFILKAILSSSWGDIQSPRAFGRKFKKAMIEWNIAEVTGKQADNKLIYTRTAQKIEDRELLDRLEIRT